MKPEAQRIAIAEACGELKQPAQKATVAELEAILNDPTPRVVTLLPNGEVRAYRNYLSDLNACHEMEKVLTVIKGGDYILFLGQVLGRSKRKDHNFDLIHAAAPQRCEAFLRTLNLWVEDSEVPSVQARPDNA